MDHRIDTQMEELKKTVLAMGTYVEEAVQKIVETFNTKNKDLLQQVHFNENKINQLQIHVDELAWVILAKQGPVARDLRQVLSILKMNNDLERMGDQAVNIAYLAKEHLELDFHPMSPDIITMAAVVKSMIQKCLDAFMRSDVKVAQEILGMDDQLDKLKDGLLNSSKAEMKKSPDWVEPGMNIILIARNLERLGDHATNIAEEVIFAVTGDDIRHKGKKV